jgi:type I restriction enzyme S subunit
MAAKAMAPKLRFKEFTSDWALGRVGEFASKIGSGSTPSGGERSYVPNGIPFIRSQNVTNNELNLDGIKFINESLNSKMSGTIVKKGDLLLNITGASIGRSCVVPNSFEVGNVNQHVCIIRLKDWHNPYFISLTSRLIEANK